jgi:TolB protein
MKLTRRVNPAVFALATVSTALFGWAAQTKSDSRGFDPSAAVVRLTNSYHPKFFLSYSPDGSHITYSRHYANRRAAGQVLMGLCIVAANGSDERRLLEAHDREVQIQEHAAWSPDGKWLAVTGGGNDTGNAAKDLFIADVENFAASTLRKLVPGAGVNVGEQPSWSPDGKQIVVTSTNATLWVIDADGKNKRKLTQLAGTYAMQPAWSPDGERIALASDRDGNCEIYTIRTDGSELTRVTNHAALDCHPKWSPDGQWLAFTSNREGNNEIYVARPDGTRIENLTRNSAFDDHPAWHPTGRSLAFVSMRDGGFDIYRQSLPATIEFAAAPQKKSKPTESPTSSAASVSDKPSSPAAGLVAHYNFDEESGTVARDKVGTNHGMLKGPTRVAGKAGKAIQFDGRDDVVDFGDPAALRLTTALSIELWVRPDSPPAAGEPLLFGRGTEAWGITYYTDGCVWFYIANGGNQIKTGITRKEWSHVVATFDGKEMKLYVNAELKEQRASTHPAAVNSGSVLTGVDLVKKTYFAGVIDEIKVYKRALPADEVKRLFDASK